MMMIIFKCRLGIGPKYISVELIPISEIIWERKFRSSDSINSYAPRQRCLVLESVGLTPKVQVCGTACWKLQEGLGM